MGPPIIDMWRVLGEVQREMAKEQLAAQPKRPFESGRTMPRNEGLERSVKRISKGES